MLQRGWLSREFLRTNHENYGQRGGILASVTIPAGRKREKKKKKKKEEETLARSPVLASHNAMAHVCTSLRCTRACYVYVYVYVWVRAYGSAPLAVLNESEAN